MGHCVNYPWGSSRCLLDFSHPPSASNFGPCDHPLHHGFIQQVVGADDQRPHPQINCRMGLGKTQCGGDGKQTKTARIFEIQKPRWKLHKWSKEIVNISKFLEAFWQNKSAYVGGTSTSPWPPGLANAGSKSIRCCLGDQVGNYRYPPVTFVRNGTSTILDVFFFTMKHLFLLLLAEISRHVERQGRNENDFFLETTHLWSFQSSTLSTMLSLHSIWMNYLIIHLHLNGSIVGWFWEVSLVCPAKSRFLVRLVVRP